MGGLAPWQVKVYDENGAEIELASGVSWDWDDDDEGVLRVSFRVLTPEDF